MYVCTIITFSNQKKVFSITCLKTISLLSFFLKTNFFISSISSLDRMMVSQSKIQQPKVRHKLSYIATKNYKHSKSHFRLFAPQKSQTLANSSPDEKKNITKKKEKFIVQKKTHINIKKWKLPPFSKESFKWNNNIKSYIEELEEYHTKNTDKYNTRNHFCINNII